MNISLGEFESYVRAQTESGQYVNASEVVRDALRLKKRIDEEHAAEHAAKLEALRADIAVAREQVRRGEVVETTADAFLGRTKRRG